MESSYNLFGDVPGGKGDLHSHSDTKRRRGKVSALAEYLVMRVINAASRTTSGGDAFFIVQDLFGGDGVFVKQSAVTAPPIEVTVDGVSGVVVTSRDCYEIYCRCISNITWILPCNPNRCFEGTSG